MIQLRVDRPYTEPELAMLAALARLLRSKAKRDGITFEETLDGVLASMAAYARAGGGRKEER